MCHEMCQVWCSGMQGMSAQFEEGGQSAIGIVHCAIYVSQAQKRDWKRDKEVQSLCDI